MNYKYLHLIPKPLLDDFVNNRVIPFVGAGFSKNADIPDFEWEQIDDVTFRISFEAAPGEYAVVFKAAKLGDYDFASIYGFTVAE